MYASTLLAIRTIGGGASPVVNKDEMIYMKFHRYSSRRFSKMSFFQDPRKVYLYERNSGLMKRFKLMQRERDLLNRTNL